MQAPRTELEHLHEPLLVENRVGVGRTDEAGDAAGHRGSHFGFEHAGMLLSGLPHARREVHQTGQHQAAPGIEGAFGNEVGGRGAQGDDAPIGNGHIGGLFGTVGRMQDAAALDQDLHGMDSWIVMGRRKAAGHMRVLCTVMVTCPSWDASARTTTRRVLVGPR